VLPASLFCTATLTSMQPGGVAVNAAYVTPLSVQKIALPPVKAALLHVKHVLITVKAIVMSSATKDAAKGALGTP